MAGVPHWSFGFCLLLLLSTSLCIRFVTSSNPEADTSTTQPQSENYVFNDPSNWKWPDLRLVSVDSQRDSSINKTHLTFNIAHSSQAFVMRTRSLDFVKKTIGVEGKYDGKQIESTVQISVDSSQCNDEEILVDESKAQFVFGLVGDNSLTLSTTVDMCKFGEGKVSENITTAKFRVFDSTSKSKINNNDEIIISPGQDFKFVIDVFLPDNSTTFKIASRLWDWDNEEMIEEIVSVYNNKMGIDYELPNFSPFYVSILAELTALSQEGNEKSARLLVTFDVGSKKLSGKLKMFLTRAETDTDEQRHVQETKTESSISLRLPYKFSIFPDGLVTDLETVGCINKDRGRLSKKCIIECQGEGEDIKSIFLVKRGRYSPPVQSVSYVINGINAYTRLDMGRASGKNDGDYQCVAVTESGRVQSRQSTLKTYGVTEVFELNIEERIPHFSEWGDCMLVCTAYGIPILNISYTLIEESGRESEMNLDKAGMGYYDSVMLPYDLRYDLRYDLTLKYSNRIRTEKLLFPNRKLRCRADGRRGSDEKFVDLAQFIQGYNRTAPIVLQDEFKAEKLPLGKSRVSCTATGGDGVDLTLHAFGERLDTKNGVTRTEHATKDGKTIVVDMATLMYLDVRHALKCQASNERGSTSKYMNHDKVLN